MSKITKTKKSAMLLFCSLLLIGCGAESDFQKYETLVEQELASGRRADSLFFNVYLGMSSKEFYMHCWEMNKKGLFTDGAGNTAVLYRVNEGLKYPASMNFYPEFRNDKIIKMGVSFKYDGWAPWNEHLVSDSLILDVLQLYKGWYHRGNPFIKIENEDRGTIYVKVDGNRRIIIGLYDDAYVKVDYTDLYAEKSLNQ